MNKTKDLPHIESSEVWPPAPRSSDDESVASLPSEPPKVMGSFTAIARCTCAVLFFSVCHFKAYQYLLNHETLSYYGSTPDPATRAMLTINFIVVATMPLTAGIATAFLWRGGNIPQRRQFWHMVLSVAIALAFPAMIGIGFSHWILLSIGMDTYIPMSLPLFALDVTLYSVVVVAGVSLGNAIIKRRERK